MSTDTHDRCEPLDPRVTRICFGAELPWGTRVEDTAWGTLVGLAGGTESGWDIGSRVLGEPALDLLFAALRGPDPAAALPGAFAAVSRWIARDPPFAADEPDLPLVTAIVALCEPGRITLAWVGNHKAYVVRDGQIVAENEEHSWRIALRGDSLARPLTPTETNQAGSPLPENLAWAIAHPNMWWGRWLLSHCTLVLDRHCDGPPAVMQLDRRAGDTLVLIDSSIYGDMGCEYGAASLVGGPWTIDRLIAEFGRHDELRSGEVRGKNDPYGPVLWFTL
jgi:hypothetical protein